MSLNESVVFRATGQRLREDRRIARHAGHAVTFDQTLKLAARNQAAADVVEPDGLAALFECKKRVHTDT